jgi:hypothetical protein
MGLKGVLFVTFIMLFPASCLIEGWRAWGQAGKPMRGNWRSMVPTAGLCFATMSQLLASGFLIQGFQSDAQSFAEPAPLYWVILNWLSVLSWSVALIVSAVGKGKIQLELFRWSLIMPLAAWIVFLMGYDY